MSLLSLIVEFMAFSVALMVAGWAWDFLTGARRAPAPGDARPIARADVPGRRMAPARSPHLYARDRPKFDATLARSGWSENRAS